MDVSLEEYLKIVAPHLPSDLISPGSMEQIQLLSSILPPFSLAGLECRLGAGQSRVDFQVSIPPVTLNLPQELRPDPVWQFLQDFCLEWVSPTSWLHQGIERIGLEFDLDEESAPIPVPCLFWKFNPGMGSVQNLLSIIRMLPTEPISSSSLESSLRLCAAAAPESARFSHLGVMLSRPTQAVRVNIRGIPGGELEDYLRQIGCGDGTETFSNLLDSISDFVDYIILALDVGEKVYPRIGLECFLNKQPSEEGRWQLFLDYLEEKELCTPGKKDALLSWEGYSLPSSEHQLWLKNISWGDRFLGARAVSCFWRYISHIKFVYQPSLLEAKAYLGFSHGWYDRNLLKKGIISTMTGRVGIAHQRV